MAKQELPEDVRDAIERHLEAAHGLGFVQAEVGMRAVKASLQIVWQPETDGEGAIFRCRRCPDGFNRYLAEVEAQAPSARILELIRDHFRRAHGERRLPLRAISYAGHLVSEPAAIYIPMLPAHGAGIRCKRCAPEGQPVYVTDPPYGDARRLRYMLQSRRLWSEVATLPPREQAEYLEAVDRGVLRKRHQREALQALRSSRPRAPGLAGDAFTSALQQTLLERVRAGDAITRLLRRIERDSKDRPAQLARLLAPHAGLSADAIDSMAPSELRRLVARRLGFADGRLPRLGERRLWTIWRDAKTTGLP